MSGLENVPQLTEFNQNQNIDVKLPCVQTMIHSFNDDRYIGFIVNIKASITSEYFQMKQKEFSYDFNVGESEWSVIVNLDQNYEKNDSLKLIKYHFQLKSSYVAGIIHQIIDYNDVNLSNSWKLKDARSWSGDADAIEIHSLPFHINMVLRYRKLFNNFQGTRKHMLFPLCKDLTSITDLQFEKPDYVTLKGVGWELHARKEVLIKTSPIFQAMFTHDMIESRESCVQIKEFSEESIRAMLTFIYSGTLKLNNPRLIFELCQLADKYCLDNLKLNCDHEICLDLNEDNIIERMITAVTYKLPLACAVCSTFIRDNFKKVVEREDWEILAGHKESVLLITRRMARVGCPSLNYRK